MQSDVIMRVLMFTVMFVVLSFTNGIVKETPKECP